MAEFWRRRSRPNLDMAVENHQRTYRVSTSRNAAERSSYLIWECYKRSFLGVMDLEAQLQWAKIGM